MAVKPLDIGGETRLGPALAEINITPFVDVVLVLLVIFLITAPMMLGGIDVRVPKTETRTSRPEERLVLTVTETEVYTWRTKPSAWTGCPRS